MTATGTTITGITDEQLEALVEGQWADDPASTPGWARWVMVEGEDEWGEVQHHVRQWVFPSFGSLPDWWGDGACVGNPQAHVDLFPSYNGKAGVEEWERYLYKQMEGLIRWCSRCPVMEKCGEWAVEKEATGPYGGRTFFEGKEMGVPKPLISKAPGTRSRRWRTA